MISDRVSAIFSNPSCKGFCTIVFINGFNSIPIVSFILHSVSVTGTICIHKLNGKGELVVANLIHLQGSFSTICNTIFPTGGTSIDRLSLSKLKFFTLSCGRRSFTLSKLLRSESFSSKHACLDEKLSDLNNLDKVKDRLPQDKVKNLSFDKDNLSIEVPPVGKIVLQIVEKEPCKCIKFATTSSPLPFNLWIQIVPVTETECKMKLTIGMELNPFMKTMVQKPLQEGLEKMAETLSLIKY